MSDKNLDKHKRYKSKYGKNEIYWGIGIENEMYLEFEKQINLSKKEFLNKVKKSFEDRKKFNNENCK